jgi:hypothetical protein
MDVHVREKEMVAEKGEELQRLKQDYEPCKAQAS